MQILLWNGRIVSAASGSPDFTKAGLIDEFRFMITPVALGAGTPIFKGLENKLYLELMKTHKFESGNILLYYKPAKNRAEIITKIHDEG